MTRQHSRLLTALLVAGIAACGAHPSIPSPPRATVPPTAATTTVPMATTPAVPSTTGSPSVTATTGPVAAPSTAPTSGPAVVVTRGPVARRVIALTFDAGSDAGNTARILDQLAADHIRATFAITGRWAEANPVLLRRIAAGTHQLVNHSYDHQSFTGASTGAGPLTRAQRVDELARAETAIRAVTGASTGGWFRPPYGDRDSTVDTDVGVAGYRYELMWTLDSLGWKGTPADVVAERCLNAASPGVIILMHVGAGSTDADALPAVIRGVRSAGYEFGTVASVLNMVSS